MSPEQARGEVETLDARSDLYALGAILSSILTLRPPVEGADPAEIVEKVARGDLGVRWQSGESCEPRRPRLGKVFGWVQRVMSNRPPPVSRPPPRPDSSPPTPRPAQSEGGVAAPARKTRLRSATALQGGVAAGSCSSPALPPHSKVPASLAAVVRKAMAFERDARYPNVAALQTEITAYQNGFATAAEKAGLLKQLVLLLMRHRGAFGTAAAAWFLITALAVWFVIKITASEHKATRNAEVAQTNEQRAVANEHRAVAGEQEAVAEKENVRREAAKARLALAEAAYREANGPAMQEALDKVPADLRDANWSYLLEQSDTSIAQLPSTGSVIRSVAPHPKQAGIFAMAEERQRVIILNPRTGETLRRIDFDLGAIPR